MRIRKNANLSSLMSSHGPGAEMLQTHVCQLNQSPWDVIPFPQEAYRSSLSQFEGEDSFNGNGSLGDSIDVVESVESMMVGAEEKASIKLKMENMVMEEEDDCNPLKKGVLEEIKVVKRSGKIHRRHKNDELNKRRSSMNDHHSFALSSNVAAASPGLSSIKKQEQSVTGSRRGRGKSAKKGSNYNPYEFYYYSGFGPLWGKRRGEANKTDPEDTKSEDAINGTPSSSYPIGHNNSFDYVEEEEEEDEEELEDNDNGDTSRKRMRKPVKARSLKSLM